MAATNEPLAYERCIMTETTLETVKRDFNFTDSVPANDFIELLHKKKVPVVGHKIFPQYRNGVVKSQRLVVTIGKSFVHLLDAVKPKYGFIEVKQAA